MRFRHLLPSPHQRDPSSPPADMSKLPQARQKMLCLAVFDTLDSLVVTLDREGRILQFNRACERITGYTRAEVLGQPLWNTLLFPDETEGVRQVFEDPRDTALPSHYENHWRTKDGDRVLIQWSNTVVCDEAGKPEFIIGTGIDVSDRRAVESQLRKILRAVEQSPVMVVITDIEGQIEYVNPAFTEITGYIMEDVLGQNPRILKSGHHSEEFYRNLWNTITQGDVWRGEFCNVKKDGERYWESAIISPVRDASGKITHFVAVKKDVTDEKRMQSAFRESEEKFRAISESAHDAIIMLDSEGRVDYWNRAAETIFGYTTEEVLGQDMHQLIVPIHYHARSDLGFCRFRETGEGEAIDRTLEVTALRRDGREFPVELSISAVKLQGEWHAVGIVRDISERKRAEQALVEAKEAAEQANRSKSQFLANMSHEIRTPMNGILGMTELLLDTRLSREQHENLEIVRYSAESLMSILNNVLDFSKVEAGRLELESRAFELRAEIGALIRLLGGTALEKGIELTWEVDPAIPKVLVGDPIRLRQVLLNLLSNGIKFTQSGWVQLCCRLAGDAPLTRDNCTLQFSVIDTGIGVPAEKQRLIFEAFQQADSSTTRRFGGSGLGLAISSQLVSMMGGHLWVESPVSTSGGLPASHAGQGGEPPGPGSAFHLTVCFALASEISQSASPAGITTPDRLRTVETAGSSLHVLLAEDNRVNQRLAEKLLQLQGHQVRTVMTGAEAVEAWSTGHYDLILMDVQMPEMDGLEATAQIRAREQATGRHTPIIALTAHAMQGDRERCLEAGMDAYVSKPLRKEMLLATMTEVMEPTGPERETASATTDFDLERAFVNMGEDEELFREVAGLFLEECPVLLAQIERALADEDPQALAARAHTLKGAVANFGADRAVELAHQLERLGKQANLEGADDIALQLRKELQHLHGALAQFAGKDAA